MDSVRCITFTVLLCFSISPVLCSSRLYFMEDICGRHLDFTKLGIESVRLQLTKFQFYHNNMDCLVRVQAPKNKRLEVKVLTRVITPSPDCAGDHLQVFDGNEPTYPAVPGTAERICDNIRIAPSYASSSQNVTVYFQSDSDKPSEGFRVLLSAFRPAVDGDCHDDEFQCRSTMRCISDSLECDDFEDCTDGSDECTLSIAAVIGLAVGGVVVAVIVTAVIVCVWRQRRRKLKAATSSTQRLSSVESSDQYITPDDSIDGGVLYHTPKRLSQPAMAVPHLMTDGTNIVVAPNNQAQMLKKSLRRSLPIHHTDSWVSPPPSSRSLKAGDDSFFNY